VAFFFATCFYDKKTREYRFFDDGQEHEAILYVFSPILDNEPSPSIKNEIYMNHNIIPIGLQAFPRPGEQQGYALHIEKGNSIKSWMYRFSFTCEDSKYYYDLFNKSKLMWSEKDKLIPYAAKIAGQRSFSFDVFNETFYNYQPKGFSRTKLKASLPSEIQLSSKIPDVKFSSLDIEDIIKDWNDYTGERTASMIRRKPWFEHDGIEEKDGEQRGVIKGIKNQNDFRTLKQIKIQQWLFFLGSPNSPKGAKWVNYTNMPRPNKNHDHNNKGWTKVPASMENMFGKEYLSEKDWKI
jgi:hypothetical protein